VQDVSPQAVVAAFVALVVGGVRVLTAVLEARNARKLKRLEQSVPPSAPTALPRKPSTSDLDRRLQRLEHTDELRIRVAVLEAELEDARGVAQDYARTAAALAASRAEQERLKVLVHELKHGRSRVPPMPVAEADVIEIDDTPTPRPQRAPRKPRESGS
jgi:hypothetical protein